MTPAVRHIHDPNAELDYVIDWSRWLPAGDTIVSASWDIPSPLTQPQAASVTTTSATAWIGGGVAGTNYLVRCRITTADGRVDDRTIELQVRER